MYSAAVTSVDLTNIYELEGNGIYGGDCDSMLVRFKRSRKRFLIYMTPFNV